MDDQGLVPGLLLCVVLGLVGQATLSVTQLHRSTLSLQSQLFLASLAVRFLVSIVVYQFGLVHVLGDEDGSGWYAGVYICERWVGEGVSLFDLPAKWLEAFEGHHRGYGYLLATLFYFTGAAARLPAAALNCFIGALTVVLAYRIARTLFSPWVAVRVGWAACLMPSMIIWSAQTVKEPVVILLESVVLYGCLQLKLNRFALRHVLACALGVLLLLPFRFYAAYLAGAAIAVSLALPHLHRGKFSLGSALAVSALVLPFMAYSGILVQHEKQIESFDLDRVEAFRTAVATGQGAGSGVESGYDLHSPTGLVMAVLVGGAHLMLAPFPWQLGGGSLRMVLTLPELVVWWWLFFAGVVPGAWYLVRNRFNDIVPLLLFTGGLGLLYSTMFGNVGLIYRQRAQLLPWLLMFAFVGLERRYKIAERLAAARRGKGVGIADRRKPAAAAQGQTA
jgi:hypothetical protein